MIYRVDFEDEKQMAILTAESDEEALNQAFAMEAEYGTVFNITLLDNNYDEVKTVL